MTGVKRNKEQVRERFKSLEAATARQQELEAEFIGMQPVTRLAATDLTAEQLKQSESAFLRIGDHTLSFVVDFFLKNYRATAIEMSLADAREQFIAAKTQANKRPRTIGDLDARIGQLVKAHPLKKVHEITTDDVAALINKPDGMQTRKNLRTVLSTFFTWCVAKKFCPASPVASVEKITVDNPEPEILTIGDCRKLLESAKDYKDGVCLPYVALGTFCAIRPAELARISWDDIDLEEKTVTLSAKIAKMRKKRIVEISDNAVELLLPHAIKKTPIQGSNWRKDFEKVRELAGLSAWPQDVMRHTGISHHLAIHQNEGKTAAWAGNSPNVIQKHYKGLVKATDAKDFWQIKPGEKIVKLKAA